MNKNELIDWLLAGDVSIEYQTRRDILGEKNLDDLRNKIQNEGWGARYLKHRNADGNWGTAFYHPKWISTHYTLLDLRNLEFPLNNKKIQESVEIVLNIPREKDGGINVAISLGHSDVCVNGMVLNYCSYFKPNDKRLRSLVGYLLNSIMKDGGWNCAWKRGAVHSSLHTTLSVLEGLHEFGRTNKYKSNEIKAAQKHAVEFMFKHRLFKSHRTGKVIKPQFTKLTYPPRWYYDILRTLDYFRSAKIKFDPRMVDAFNLILKKRKKDGTWNLQSKHKGVEHFEMEKVGEPSRWNTLRAIRIFKYYRIDI